MHRRKGESDYQGSTAGLNTGSITSPLRSTHSCCSRSGPPQATTVMLDQGQLNLGGLWRAVAQPAHRGRALTSVGP